LLVGIDRVLKEIQEMRLQVESIAAVTMLVTHLWTPTLKTRIDHWHARQMTCVGS